MARHVERYPDQGALFLAEPGQPDLTGSLYPVTVAERVARRACPMCGTGTGPLCDDCAFWCDGNTTTTDESHRYPLPK